MFKIYFTILNATAKKFGFGSELLVWALLLPIYRFFTHFTLFLDRIFFPEYRQKPIVNPVFIIGSPRSGTSFLHTLLTQTREFSAFETWELMFPSLTARILVKPIVNHLATTNPATIMDASLGHEMSLKKIEHDEFLFMHRIEEVGRQLSLILFKKHNSYPELPELDIPDRQPQYIRNSSIDFYKRCLQRQVYYTGKDRLIAHAHFSTLRIKTLLEAFPDAKFVYLIRSPYEVIPSAISFNYSAIRDKDNSPVTLQKMTKQVYQEALELYRYFYELQKNQEIAQDNYTIVTYKELRSNLEGAIQKIVKFTGIELSQELQKSIEQQNKIQKDYKRKHKNFTLEDLGLTKEQIAEDFSFIFEYYCLENPLNKTEQQSLKQSA